MFTINGKISIYGMLQYYMVTQDDDFEVYGNTRIDVLPYTYGYSYHMETLPRSVQSLLLLTVRKIDSTVLYVRSRWRQREFM